ncbi:MAG: VanZ family protein [Oceanospirillales bacterium]|uniref:VanZ like protein n=1 Tax=Marinobacterium halophilum TaxID=267374 RepID=A0A2P8F233_9GAMM|nr:VanZ family protein [Marinobacterium halophilum]MBR9827617.1 VanZ family protein [Oceanospirillales bacterium]PSL15785.1 hypothetical protein CLV44_10366 [Marinobacterium halophilum]
MLHLLLSWPVRLLVFLTCLAGLSYGLFRPQPPPDLFGHSDKWMHLCAFLVFACCARLAFLRCTSAWLWGLLLCSGPLLEYLQQLLQPARVFSSADAVANVAGVLLAWLLWFWVDRPLRVKVFGGKVIDG